MPLSLLPPTNTATPFDAMLTLQRQWFEQTTSWLQQFGASDNRSIEVETGDVNIYFPFGQGFTLFANPATSWFDMLATHDSEAERRIVTGVASYGKQIGWMMDLLIPLAEESGSVDKKDLKALKDLKAEIEAAKTA